MTFFEEMTEFVIFNRDPKQCSIPVKISPHVLQKFETIRDRRYKEKHRDSTGLYIYDEKKLVWHIKKKVTTNTKINSVFVTHLFEFLHPYQNFLFDCKMDFVFI